MIYIDLELFRFRDRLLGAGVTPDEVDIRVENLRDEINTIIRDVVNQGLVSAQDAALSVGAQDQLDDLYPDYSRFQISTYSGKTDFTVPPWDMKPQLLKNAKISKKGVRYKVIPVGKEGEQPKLMSSGINQPFMSLEETQKAIGRNMEQSFVDRALQAKAQGKKLNAYQESMIKKHGPGHTEYRTVTDKQPAGSWWHPGFERDLTGYFQSLNEDIQSGISRLIMETINSHEAAATQKNFPFGSFAKKPNGSDT